MISTNRYENMRFIGRYVEYAYITDTAHKDLQARLLAGLSARIQAINYVGIYYFDFIYFIDLFHHNDGWLNFLK